MHMRVGSKFLSRWDPNVPLPRSMTVLGGHGQEEARPLVSLDYRGRGKRQGIAGVTT
jgi:hypothetical protein